MIYIHISLFAKGLFNLLILIILLIISRNIKLLKPYQKLYLVLSIIIWLFIVLNYFGKFSLLIIVKLRKKKFIYKKELELIFKFSLIGINIPPYIIMLIAIIYDCNEILKGNIRDITYECIFCTIFIIFVCFTLNDYYQLRLFINLIFEKKIIKEEEEKEKSKDATKLEGDEEEYEFDLKNLKNKILDSDGKFKQKAL